MNMPQVLTGSRALVALIGTILSIGIFPLAHAASAQGAPPQKEALVPEGWPQAPAHASWVTKAGGFVFCTGMLGLDVSTFELASETFEQESEQLLENLRAMLQSAGATADDLVQVTVYLTDLDLYPTFNELYVEFLGGGVPPARTAVVVSELPMGASVEVDCVAVAP